MLTIKDKTGKTKFIWSDDSSEPTQIDDLITNDKKKKDEDAESKEGKE